MTPLRCTALALLALVPAGTALAAKRSARPAPAAAQAARLSAAPDAVQAGGTVTLTGRGFPRNARIALLATSPDGDTHRMGGAQTGSRGSFTATIRIRARSAAGRLVASACADDCRVKATARFRIVAP